MLIIKDGDVDETSIKSKIGQLKEKSAIDTDVNFAAGYYIANKGEDIRTAMRLADEKMYIDKKEYYAKHPELKYR